jgi:hypothetical protein
MKSEAMPLFLNTYRVPLFLNTYLHIGVCEGKEVYKKATDLGAESSGSGDAVQVGVGVLGHVVVEDDVDALDVHATAEQVGGHQDSLRGRKTGLVKGDMIF